MKKIIAMLLAVVMLLGLVACGTKPVETTAPVEADPVETTAPAADAGNEEIPTLIWYQVGGGQPATTSPGRLRSTPTWRRRSASIWMSASAPGATGATCAPSPFRPTSLTT